MSRQSPIDIKDAVSGSFDSILDIKFETITGPAAQNTGHCLHLDTVGHIEGKLSGGPLVAATYSLQQFHFHWGDDADKGMLPQLLISLIFLTCSSFEELN